MKIIKLEIKNVIKLEKMQFFTEAGTLDPAHSRIVL